MDFRVDEEGMRTLVAKSIVDALTPEAREKLIASAIKQALTPRAGSSYGGKRSPIEMAFDNAVETEARRYAGELLACDEAFQANLKKLFAMVVEKLFAEESMENVSSGITAVIRSALTKDRW